MRYILFIKEECPYCTMAQDLLEKRSLSYNTVIFESEQESVLDEIKKAYEWGTVPMIFFRDGAEIEFVGGFSDLQKYLCGDE